MLINKHFSARFYSQKTRKTNDPLTANLKILLRRANLLRITKCFLFFFFFIQKYITVLPVSITSLKIVFKREYSHSPRWFASQQPFGVVPPVVGQSLGHLQLGAQQVRLVWMRLDVIVAHYWVIAWTMASTGTRITSDWYQITTWNCSMFY